ncbi:hypothetical protein [Geomicrobium sediminis]|uniref:Fibronectin type-III domain-containing protein n=1 Tax=Geomicrobium sediminis TaxID=1347788 RepID=A0ABS2PA99_9BACL|nr:hypothetical protein [Geomicrobium sediminis]MBM7632234.1 hypothetical protein [Geomicrobium sediminis]
MKVMTLFTLTGFLIILVTFSFVTTNDPASDSREPQDSQVVHEQLAEGDSTDDALDESESREQTPPAPEQVEITGTFLTWHAVRDDDIDSYRIYKVGEDGDEHVASIAQNERKTYTVEELTQFDYYVTSVTEGGTESEPSEIVSP